MNNPEFVEARITEMIAAFPYIEYHQQYYKSRRKIADEFSGGTMLHDQQNDLIVSSYHDYLTGKINTRQFIEAFQDFLCLYNGDDENTMVNRARGGLEDKVEALSEPLKEDFREYFSEKMVLVKKVAELIGKPDLAESLKFIADVDLVLLGHTPIKAFVNVMTVLASYGLQGLL